MNKLSSQREFLINKYFDICGFDLIDLELCFNRSQDNEEYIKSFIRQSSSSSERWNKFGVVSFD